MRRHFTTVCAKFSGKPQRHYCAAYAEQRDLKREFAHQKHMLELVLNAAGDAIVACDCDARTTHFNLAAERLTGYRADEMLGQSAHDMLHAREPNGTPIAASDCPLIGVSRGGEPHSGQASIRRRDGSFFPIEYASAAMRDDHQITGYVVVFRDITERLRVQDQVRHLQARVAHMEKMATIGLLVTSVAHEIKNPLTFIRTGLGILETCLRKGVSRVSDPGVGPIDAPEAKEALDACKEGVERIVDIVDTLRTFSRIDSRDDCSVDLASCLDVTLKLMRASLPSRVRIHRQIEAVARAQGHPSQINQILVNLLMNAIQAMEEVGDIWVRIFAEGGMVVLEVEDNGRGMDPSTLQRIFEPFFTTKSPEQGTGLGLSICQDIVVRYGGRLTATSVPGTGTCFRVTLPAQRASQGGPR